jgi:hypothetical protein
VVDLAVRASREVVDRDDGQNARGERKPRRDDRLNARRDVGVGTPAGRDHEAVVTACAGRFDAVIGQQPLQPVQGLPRT